MRFLLPLLALLLPGLPAAAQPVRAVYDVYAAGMTVLQLEATFDVSAEGYRVETRFRTRGIAATFVPGEQVSRVQGQWSGAAATPGRYLSEGVWRGRARRILLAWQDGDPQVLALEPEETEEREAVPVADRRGTIDALSAMALLSRNVARDGACEGAAQVFDGRRRSDFASSTAGRERIRPWRGAWHGDALRCAFEGRQVAGFLRDQARGDAATPQRGTAWIAAPFPGAPPIPVRIEIPSRWFGTATAVLLEARPSAVADRRQ
ncbi:DUF3108 domain-containing protein [Falsiroseomonas selenitidurans]|uniref:DUF3108 domain-containing protein n=1 Tax=Falsiroseomonas selenitidurans TaxID=2716335 RepID=A0ABX1DYH4_9PROT|nr:DUF3108 domain-containing protein [Falsiroseomonas selenitidurans]NKC29548.1 DUF3108 domain-containing protein [Falsiroseomonas selenitidurans]